MGIRDAKNEDFDPSLYFQSLATKLETAFAADVVYSDILDWFDNGGVDKKALGAELNPRQRVILKTFYGVELTDEETSILEFWKAEDRTTYDFDFGPTKRTNLVLECGRRGSKTFIGSLIINYEFEKLCRLESPQRHYNVASSTLISMICVAPSAEQVSKTIYGQARAMMDNVFFLRKLIDAGKIQVLEKMIRYDDKLLYIYSGNSKSETQVGGSPILIVLDEGALFEDKDGRSNALTLWDNLGAGGITFKDDAKRIIISSAWEEGDALQVLYQASIGSQNWIAYRLMSWQLNPEYAARDNPIIASMYNSNRKMAELLFEGIRSSNANAFLDALEVKRSFRLMSNAFIREISGEADSLIKLHVMQIEPYKGYTVMHLDPAVSKDAYALAYGHLELMDGQSCVCIDGIAAWIPSPGKNVSIVNVQHVVYQIHSQRPLSLISSDPKESSETLQRFKANGIPVEVINFTNQKQVAMYDAVRKLLHEDRLILPKNSPWTERLKDELIRLRFIDNKKIDHPPNGCFTAETRIPLLDGTTARIAELEGREVWVVSCRPDGLAVPGRARGRKTKEVVDLLEVELDNKAVIRCTPEHLFMTHCGNYSEAQHLIPEVTLLMPFPSDFSINSKQEKVRVRTISQIKLESPVPVYDLEVDEWDNFALSAGIFVHNSKDLADCIAGVVWNLMGKELMMEKMPVQIYSVPKKVRSSLGYADRRLQEDNFQEDRHSFSRDLRATRSRWGQQRGSIFADDGLN
jgi:hypothetical protein